VFGGPSSTLTAAELDTIHQLRIPYVLTYASGTRLVQNGRQPNFVFRVGPSDTTAGQAVATYLGTNLAKRKPTVIAEESLWSDSAAQGIGTGLTGAGLKVAGVEKLGSGSVDGAALGRALDGAGADSVVLVADPASGLRTVEALTQRGWNATSKPIVSAWGISPAQPPEPDQAPPNGVSVLQTYSFWGELSIPGKRVSSGYQRKYGGSGPADILAPSAVADGFDAAHIMVRALREVPDPDDSDPVRQALENLQTPYEGVIKNYQRPFAPNQHEALGPEDYTIVTWRDGQAQNERPTGR
jgi:branched-chain amino acid transport system substrate-binding protein